MEGLIKLNNKQSFEFSVLPSFWILAFVAILSKSGYLLGLYTISVLIHEFAHFFVAKKLKYDCHSIKLSAFGAVLYGDFDDVDCLDGIKIARAGPLVNIILATLTVALWWVFPSAYVWSANFVSCNISLALTNLLPCYPLDGGRIFVASVKKNHGLKRALKVSRLASLVVGCLFFAVFLVGILFKQNFYSCGVFGFFLVLTSNAETKKAIYSRKTYIGASKQAIKKGVEKKCLVFDGEATLYEVLKKLKDNCFYQITVVLGEKDFFVLEQTQINYCLTACTLDTQLKNLIKYAI